MKSLVILLLAVWFALVAVLGANHAFISAPGKPPVPIIVASLGPLLLFLVALWASSAFRNFVATADLSLITAVQAWRAGGLAFLALYAHGVLPGAFAWPAGLGDMAIGFTAPWLAVAVARRPSFAASRLFMIWNLLGILALVVAVSDGALHQLRASGAQGASIAPMAMMPLVFIPAFLVPLFVMLHITAIIQSRRRR